MTVSLIGVERAVRAMPARLVIAALALASGLAADASFGDRALDRLTPDDVGVDKRVVVIAFDGATDVGTAEAQYLRATTYRDVATIVERGRAAAVAFVDFDSLTFSDGSAGRSNVIGADVLQRTAVIPLRDVAVSAVDGALPVVSAYRVDALATEVAGVGLPVLDSSGTTRTVPALARVESLADGTLINTPDFAMSRLDSRARSVVSGLALRLVELATGAALAAPTSDSVMVGGQRMPLERGHLRIAWSHRLDSLDDPAVISFFDLMTGALPDGVFEDAVVLVGTVDRAATPFVTTPIGELPPVLVHANAANTILGERFVTEGPSRLGLIAGSIAALVVVLLMHRRRLLMPMTAAAISIGWLVVARYYAADGMLIDALTVPVAAVVAALLMGGRAQLLGTIEQHRLRNLFSQYVAPSVADQLVKTGRGNEASSGQRVAISTVFCDLRGFTLLTGRLDPGQVRRLLNLYYEELGAVVFEHGGTVLQYTGDEIFAVFGAPLPLEDHPQRALACAIGLFARLTRLNDSLLAEALPPVNFGVGVHSGDAIAAHVGSSVRMQYSVIGETVNVGSRHCSFAGAGEIVVSDTTAALTGGIAGARRVDEIELKGVSGRRSAYVLQAGPTATSGSPELLAPGGTGRDGTQPQPPSPTGVEP